MSGAGRRVVGRAFEWLTLREAAREARRGRAGAAQRAHLARARLSLAAADDVAAQGRAGDDGAAALASLGMYRDAVYHALRGLAGGDDAGEPGGLEGALARLAPHAAEAGAPDADVGRVAAALRPDVDARAERPAHALHDDLAAVQPVARALVRALAARCEREREVLRRRVARPLAVALACGAVWAGGSYALRVRHPDMAATARWTASSASEGLPVSGVGVRWPDAKLNVFFHTAMEPNPWVAFDLGRDAVVHSFEVTNRGDCCLDRAVPLVVETSTDGHGWAHLAQRTTRFLRWGESVAPRRARYVRFRAAMPTMLHFASVTIR